mmetsp:Transcript_18065/g.43739  ORF Transcript_18065/g.43739 Transcript_18065/m.43739 type:complete len:256 (-) Transcript_18065:38-805(-)
MNRSNSSRAKQISAASIRHSSVISSTSNAELNPADAISSTSSHANRASGELFPNSVPTDFAFCNASSRANDFGAGRFSGAWIFNAWSLLATSFICFCAFFKSFVNRWTVFKFVSNWDVASRNCSGVMTLDVSVVYAAELSLLSISSTASHASAASLLDAPNCWDTALALAMAAAAAALFPVVLAPNKAVVAVVVDGEDGLTTMTLTWNAETSVAVMATTIEHAAAAEARDDGIFMVFGRNFSFLRFGSGSLFVLI